jgi:N6-L-threonylcarbamoyladenine synthase
VILALETSCDETAAALVSDDGRVLASVVSSQAELHARYGGVVPEVASRRHLELVTPVIRETLEQAGASLDDVERVAVTRGPGLIGALLVGVQAAKAIAWSRRLPLVPVDHLHGHVASLFLRLEGVSGSEPQTPRGPGSTSSPSPNEGDGRHGSVEALSRKSASGSEPQGLPLEPPFLCLLASGGHTMLLDVQEHARWNVLGSTLDDAAGEAFDKGARLLGLGYPGGAAIDRLARDGDPEAFSFPVARLDGLDFSFSGVKTALLYAVRDLGDEAENRRPDLAASYQRAIVRALVDRTREAAERIGATRVAVVGGVAANSELRASLPEATLAPLALCTDNAAMIGSAARFVEAVPYPRYLGLDAYASAL